MGKNLYETPRDKAKWNVGDPTRSANKPGQHTEDARKNRLEKLKAQFEGKKKKKK